MIASLFLTSCAPWSARTQLDYLWSRVVIELPGSSQPTTLVAGRYTIFDRENPNNCSRGLSITGTHFTIPRRLASVLLVQEDLPAGQYWFKGSSDIPGCAVEIQTILNSVSPGTAPPPRPRISVPKPAPLSIGSTGDPNFTVSDFGGYIAAGQVFPLGQRICSYDIALTRPGGADRLFVMRRDWPDEFSRPQSPSPDKGSISVVLGTGRWRVDARTDCPWSVTIQPQSEGGGGAIGF
jgi:hypothetical protein